MKQYSTFPFILFWLVITIQHSTAQQIRWSSATKMSSIYNQPQIIGAGVSGFHSLYNYKDEQYFFQKRWDYYNNNLELEKSVALDSFSYEQKTGRHLTSFSILGQPYSCFLVNDPENQSDMIFATALDTSSLKNSSKIPLFQVNYNNKIHDEETYKVCTSPNQKKFLFYNKMPYNKKENAEVNLFVSDNQLVQFSSAVIPIAEKSTDFHINDVANALVDDDGNAFLLCKIYKHREKKEEKKQGPQFVYFLIILNKNSEATIFDTLRILAPKDSAVIISASLSYNLKTKSVHCVGTFKGANDLQALFDYQLMDNPDNKINVITYPNSFVEESYVSPRLSQKKKKLGLENYKIKQILEQENGDKIILAEQEYTYVYFDKSEGRQETHRTNNILITRLAADTIQWVQTLCKRQKSGGVGYSNLPQQLHSFFAAQHDDFLLILYNDLESNLAIKDELELKNLDCNNPKEGSLISCELDLITGNISSKKSLFNFKESQAFFVPTSAIITNNKQVLFLAYKPETQAKNNAAYRFGLLF